MSARLADPKPVGARGPMNRERAAKIAAKRIGITVAEYEARRASGEKWCSGCKRWHDISAFAIDRSRGDGRNHICKAAYTVRYAYAEICVDCGGPRHTGSGQRCRRCYLTQSVINAGDKRLRKLQRSLQRRIDREIDRGSRSLLWTAWSLDAPAIADADSSSFYDVTSGRRLRLPTQDDPLEAVQRERLWEIVGDLDPGRLGERELQRLREQLIAEGFAPPPITEAERERLKEPNRHAGALVAKSGGHGGGKRSRKAQQQVTRDHHVRELTGRQKRHHAAMRRERAA